MTELRTHVLDVPGATLRYDVRDALAETRVPPLLMIGSPMDASGFTTLAGHFRDRTVVTYDPRGVSRSERTDGASGSTPDEHADDLHRLIAAIGTGPVDVFASSGGAVNALALVAGAQSRCAPLSRRSRPPRACCRIASRRWQPSWTSARPTGATASAPRWRSSSC